jgi:molybdopterin-containing oxidoreductase family iron-sulfur binding subunit
MPDLDRRDFLKLVGAGAGAAATLGCEPVEKLIPYVVQPEEITPGLPVFYASTCRECPAACGVHVRTREGRPVKLEGNPEHPINRGALCARGQSSIGRTYHPDRYRGPMLRGPDGALAPISWEEAIRLLASKIGEARSGTYLLGRDPGPTAAAVLDRFVAAVGAGGRIVYEPFAPEALRSAAAEVFGGSGTPRFDLSGADLVVDFGSDFLEAGPSPVEHARQLAEARAVRQKEHGGARFVYVGPRLSLTAANADQWLPARPGSEGLLALALAHVVAQQRGGADPGLAAYAPAQIAAKVGIDAASIETLGRALAAASAPAVLPPGVALASRRATATTAAVLYLNHLAGASGRTLFLDRDDAPRSGYRDVLTLVEAMKSDRVKVLIVHDADPVHSLPKSAGFAEALAKVPLVVATASMPDETAQRAGLILPDHTPLESWGDAAPRPGVRSLVQPSVRPLFDTRALVDTLLDTGRALGEAVAAALPAGSFRTLVEAAWSEDGDFRQALAKGGRFAEARGEAPAQAIAASRIEVAEPLLEGEGEYVLLAHPHPFLYDGRGANLPWLQEIPDPVSKVVWQSWLEVSNATAAKLGVSLGDVVAVTTSAGSLEVPVLPRGGLRDDVVALAIGRGQRAGTYASLACDGQPGVARGVNVLDVLPAATDENGGRAWLSAKAGLRATGGHYRLALMQFTDNKRQRQLGESVALAALAGGADPHAGGHEEAHAGPHEIRKPFDPTLDTYADSPYRWGMSIDLDRCVGCSACVAACYVENNIPVVGEDQCRWGRVMSWIRIERYVGDGAPDLDAGAPRVVSREALGDVDVRHSPMLCQQCGAAPCEPVCPVIATYHNPEGLNGMIYNRCIGTRYCSNNCPYKVRRFNYYENTKTFAAPLHLMLNPDVTVRGQGVMEKCTFCVQRISAARQLAKDEGRPIKDGEITPACAQSCPTQAITFGNLKDPASRVVTAGNDPARSYHALHMLNTRPAVTYLAKVKRGPVEA